jgi:hypothetical protein
MKMSKRKTLPTVDVRLMAHDHKAKSTFVNQRIIAAHIGQFAMELFRQEMVAVEPALVGGHNPDGSQIHQRPSVEACVQRACLGAEMLFNEMHRRGWVVLSPESDDVLAEDEARAFGLHRG